MNCSFWYWIWPVCSIDNSSTTKKKKSTNEMESFVVVVVIAAACRLAKGTLPVSSYYEYYVLRRTVEGFVGFQSNLDD